MENSPRVLVVEDEIAHQDILESALEDGGFSVAKATTGEEALVMLDAEDAKYRAVITDVNLGSAKVTGWQVAKRAREKNSELPIVYMTGGGGHDWGSMGVPNSVLLTKPFAAAQVVTAVSQLLNLGNTPGPNALSQQNVSQAAAIFENTCPCAPKSAAPVAAERDHRRLLCGSDLFCPTLSLTGSEMARCFLPTGVPRETRRAVHH